MTLYWTDLFVLSFFTAIVLIVTVVWFWKKKFLFSADERNVDNLKCDSKKLSSGTVTFQTLQEMKNLLIQDQGFSTRKSLHGKMKPEDEDLKSEDHLRNYLQGLTSERRTFLSSCLEKALTTMVQGFETSGTEKEFSEILRGCVLDLSFLIAIGTDSQFNPVLCETLKDVIELWPDYKGSEPNDGLGNIDKFKDAIEVLKFMLKEKVLECKSKELEDEQSKTYLDQSIQDEIEANTIAKNVLRFLVCCSDSLYKTLLAALAHLTDSMDVLKKMQSELRESLDSESLVSLWLQHRGRVPYSESVLKEVLRLSTPVATVTGNRKHDGSKDAFSTADLKSMLQNPKAWGEDHDLFVPKRFLDADGKVIQHEFFIPFGLGHASCPAQDFATLSCFVILATVLKRLIAAPPVVS